MSWVWENSPEKGSALLLLLAIADHADDDGVAYPSIKKLADKTRLKPRNTQLLVQKLADSRSIGLDRGIGPRGCNVYRVQGLQGALFDDEGVQSSVKRGATAIAPESLEPSLKPSKVRKHPHWAELLPDWIPPEPWIAFVEMRRKARKPLETIRAVELLIKKLDEFRARGFTPQAVLEQSTMNSWTGLFELKDVKPTTTPSTAPTCEFRGKTFNPAVEPCGMPNAMPSTFYGGRKVCTHHRHEVEHFERKPMPDEVRAALKVKRMPA